MLGDEGDNTVSETGKDTFGEVQNYTERIIFNCLKYMTETVLSEKNTIT